jgi:uncharacterized damage-inducible protein DinB
MKNQRYIDYTVYTIWANNRLINSLHKLNDEQLIHEFVGSFPTIRATVLHLWLAETGWLSRLNDKGWDASKVTNFSDTNNVLFASWQATTNNLKDFVEKADLEKEVQFEHKGKKCSIPTREIIQTVCNHGSFHRGQIVMMLRQLGVTEIAQTDYIEWVRENGGV